MIPEGVKQAEIIGSEKCKCCGNEIDLKITKHGKLFGKCFHVIDPEAKGHAKYCGHVEQYPLWKSTELINQYIEQKGIEENVQIQEEPAREPERTETRDDGEPKPKPEKSFFGKLFDWEDE